MDKGKGRGPLNPGRGKLPLHPRHVCDMPVARRGARQAGDGLVGHLGQGFAVAPQGRSVLCSPFSVLPFVSFVSVVISNALCPFVCPLCPL